MLANSMTAIACLSSADYLRDNLTQAKAGLVMRDFNFAVVDEVDSILIDEARTPLIISGTAGKLGRPQPPPPPLFPPPRIHMLVPPDSLHPAHMMAKPTRNLALSLPH